MTLLPPNSTDLEANVDAVTERISDVKTPLRYLWNPQTSPEHLLPWLAWALGVDAWKSTWPLSVKRSILANAVAIRKRKGTAQSVRSIVEAFGTALALREGWQTDPPGPPHSFNIAIDPLAFEDELLTADFQQDVIDEVSRTKPARSYFTVTAGINAEGALALFGTARAAIYTRLRLNEAT